MRLQAVYALGEIGGEEAASILQLALSDDSELVWDAASEVLDELSGGER